MPAPLLVQILDAAFEPDPCRIEVHMQVQCSRMCLAQNRSGKFLGHWCLAGHLVGLSRGCHVSKPIRTYPFKETDCMIGADRSPSIYFSFQDPVSWAPLRIVFAAGPPQG